MSDVKTELAAQVGDLIAGRTASAGAKAVIKAGFRVPRVITDVGDLALLPDTAVIRDNSGDVSEKRGGLWCGYETGAMSSRQMAKFLPATILDEGYAK